MSRLSAVVIPAGTPFIPLASIFSHATRLDAATTAARVYKSLEIVNGTPKTYSKRHTATLDQARSRMMDLCKGFPAVSEEMIVLMRKLEYPEWILSSLKSKSFDRPTPTTSSGKVDWQKMSSLYGLSKLQSDEYEGRGEWENRLAYLKQKFAAKEPLQAQPRVNFPMLYKNFGTARRTVDELRFYIDSLTSKWLLVDPATCEKYMKDSFQAEEDMAADQIMEFLPELELYVRLTRRMSLASWMDDRGDLTARDLMDLLPKLRDINYAANDANEMVYLDQPDLDVLCPTMEDKLVPWSQLSEDYSAKAMEWIQSSTTESLSVEEEEKRRIDSVISSFSKKTTDAAAGASTTTTDAAATDKEAVEDTEKRLDLSKDPPMVKAMMRGMFGENYEKDLLEKESQQIADKASAAASSKSDA